MLLDPDLAAVAPGLETGSERSGGGEVIAAAKGVLEIELDWLRI